MPAGSNNYNGDAEGVLVGFGETNAYKELERRYAKTIKDSESGLTTDIVFTTGVWKSPTVAPALASRIVLLNNVVLSDNSARSRREKTATDETRTYISGLAQSRAKYIVSWLIPGAAASKTILGSHLSESFRSFLNEVNKAPEFSDTLVTQYVKQLFWHLGQVFGLPQIPNPQAIPSEGDTLALWWQTDKDRLGIYVYNDGLIDWVHFDKTTKTYQSGEDVQIKNLPDHLIQHLAKALL